MGPGAGNLVNKGYGSLPPLSAQILGIVERPRQPLDPRYRPPRLSGCTGPLPGTQPARAVRSPSGRRKSASIAISRLIRALLDSRRMKVIALLGLDSSNTPSVAYWWAARGWSRLSPPSTGASTAAASPAPASGLLDRRAPSSKVRPTQSSVCVQSRWSRGAEQYSGPARASE